VSSSERIVSERAASAVSQAKETEVSWLREVPAHWQHVQLGRIGRFSKGSGGTKEDEVPDGVPCIRYGDLYSKYGSFITNAHSFVDPERVTDYTPVRFGDLLFAGSGETLDEIGKSAVNLIQSDVVCGGDVVIFRPNRVILPRFLGYAADCPSSIYQKACMGRGTTVMHIYADELKYLHIALPPIAEQAAIVRFLDYADRRIRRAIRAKRKLIALLNELKQSVIHRAVTRGLDPNVRLRPSGVEWLGDVPEHWQVKRLYQATDPRRPIMYGIVLPGPNVDEGVYIVKGGNCEPGCLQPERLSRTTHEIDAAHSRSRLRANDIVFAIRGGVGAAEVVPPGLEGANLTQDAARIAPADDVRLAGCCIRFDRRSFKRMSPLASLARPFEA
jgi:type I restriction enzyme S subunit